MSRRVGWIVVATALVSVLFASVTTAGPVPIWQPAEWVPSDADAGSFDLGDARPAPNLQPEETEDRTPTEAPGWLRFALRVVFYLLVAAAIPLAILALIGAWRNRPRVRWHRRWSGEPEFDALPDVAAAVVDEAASQRAALLGGEPRNGIVGCWLRLERDVEAAGLRRQQADTSAEFTERVLGRYTVDDEAIRELAALYREARFSEHPIEESSRLAALAALERLHRALAAGQSASGDDALAARS